DGRDAELAGQFGQGDESGGLVSLEPPMEAQGGIIGVGARPGGAAVVGDPAGDGGVGHDRFPSLRRAATSAVSKSIPAPRTASLKSKPRLCSGAVPPSAMSPAPRNAKQAGTCRAWAAKSSLAVMARQSESTLSSPSAVRAAAGAWARQPAPLILSQTTR